MPNTHSFTYESAREEMRLFTDAIIARLDELDSMLAALTPAIYRAQSGGEFMHASVGAHVRHCLDHLAALTDGLASGVIDYDHRQRGTPIELDPTLACAEITRLRAALAHAVELPHDRPVAILCMAGREGQAQRLASTLGRELAFVLSHTIHHQAMLRGMCVSLGVTMHNSFGFAPSTLAHHDSTQPEPTEIQIPRKDDAACAR